MCPNAQYKETVVRQTIVKAAIIQLDIHKGKPEWNLAIVKRRIASLARRGAQLILLPEMWSTGFAMDSVYRLSETTPRVLEEMGRMSKKLNLVIIGSLPEKAEKRVWNTAYVVDNDGSIAGAYRKVHLFTPSGEDRYFLPGDRAVVCKTSVGPVGLMICYDLRFPELCRSLAMQGAQIVAVLAQWPDERALHWKVLLRARAIENQLFILGANRCGADNDVVYAGRSSIISPWGEIQARAGRKPALLSAPIDLSLVREARERIPCLAERVPEAYG